MYKLKAASRKPQVLTAIFLVLLKFGFGQNQNDTGKFSFSLKQCIDYALQNQSAMKNASLDELIAKDKVKEITGLGLPQIGGSVQFANNDPLRRFFLEGTGGPSFIQKDPPYLPEGVYAFPNFFQLRSSGDASISVTQLIFSSSYIVGLQAAKVYKELSMKVTQQTKIQVTENVSKAYYLVLINQERIKLFDKNISRLDSLLSQTSALNKNGFVEKIDVDRLQVAYNNLQTEKEKFSNLLSLSVILLKYQMAMPLNADLSLAEKISDYKAENPSVQKTDYKNRVEYSMLESQKKLQQLDLKNYKLAYLPRIAAFANGGEFSQSPKFNYFSKSNLWYWYGMYGINISVPIFDGLQNSYKTKQTKLKLQKTENDMQMLKLSVELQMQSASISLKNNLASLESQRKNIELAEEVAKITKIKYKEGIGSSLEVTSAETALLEAQTNYYNALYEALVSKVDYDKANGNLVK